MQYDTEKRCKTTTSSSSNITCLEAISTVELCYTRNNKYVGFSRLSCTLHIGDAEKKCNGRFKYTDKAAMVPLPDSHELPALKVEKIGK